jgi:hypothetical protein
VFLGESPGLKNPLLANRTREADVDYVPEKAILRTERVIRMRIPDQWKGTAHLVKPFPQTSRRRFWFFPSGLAAGLDLEPDPIAIIGMTQRSAFVEHKG